MLERQTLTNRFAVLAIGLVEQSIALIYFVLFKPFSSDTSTSLPPNRQNVHLKGLRAFTASRPNPQVGLSLAKDSEPKQHLSLIWNANFTPDFQEKARLGFRSWCPSICSTSCSSVLLMIWCSWFLEWFPKRFELIIRLIYPQDPCISLLLCLIFN